MKSSMDYHYFGAMFWDQKVCGSPTELYQFTPDKKTSGCRIRP